MDNIDLTEKQIERLKQETKHMTAFNPNGESYIPKIENRQNGYYYHVTRYRIITDSTVKTLRQIARRTRTTYSINLMNDCLELRFYASFDKLPKSLL